MTHRTFTDSFIRNLKPKAQPYKRAEAAPKGEGRLIVRVLPGGAKEFFYRYRTSGQDKTLSLGRYDGAGRNGLTLAGVRERAHDIRALQRSTGDVKEHLRAEERQRDINARQGSLRQLLAAYVKALRDAGKSSTDQVEGIFRRNVLEPFRVVADAKASEIEPGDIQRILARLVKQGIKRQVNVTRSYLRAAFAHGNADRLELFRILAAHADTQGNPAAGDDIDGSDLFRGEGGGAQGQEEHSGAQADAARARGHGGQRGERVEGREVEEDVLTRPGGVVAHLLDTRDILPLVREEVDAELEDGHRPGQEPRLPMPSAAAVGASMRSSSSLAR